MKSYKLCVLVLSMAVVLLSAPVKAQWKLLEKVEPQAGKVLIPYEKWELEANGLTLYIHEDHSDPIVHVDVTYHVGSARETPGKSGFAHFFEHMMFQGSENVGDEMHFKYISEAGGNLNGTTNRDRTNYFQTMPSNQLELALWLEADRMGFLLDSVTTQKFEVQRSTVKNEKGQNVENQPYGLLGETQDQNLYPQGHPYSWPTIGYVDDLDRSTVDDLKKFFMRWYGPNNASLVVAGDVNPQEVRDLVLKYYGSIPKGPEVRRQRVERVNLPVDRYVNIKDNVFFPLTAITFPTVPAYHPDEPAIDFLAEIIGNGSNSALYKSFVKTDSAIQVGMSNRAEELSGELTIYVLAYQNVTSKVVEEKVRTVLDDFANTGVSDEKLAALKAGKVNEIIGYGESVLYKASALAQWHFMLGRTYNLQDEIDRYNRVTKQDIINAYNKYVKGKNALFINVLPYARDEKAPAERSMNPNKNIVIKEDPSYAGLSYTKPKDTFDRSKKPEPKAPRPVTVPDYYEASLPNGISIIGTASKETPLIRMVLNIKGAHMLENEKNIGVASLTASMMNESTAKYTSEEIEFELEKLGSSIDFSSGRDYTTIQISTVKEKLVPTMALLEEKMFNPKFSEADFKRVKKQTLEGIRSEKTSATTMANKVYANLIYGNTIMGLPVNGTEKTVEGLTVKDVKAFYDANYSPSVTSLVVVGDISKDEVMNAVSFLNKWKAKPVTVPVITAVPAHPTPTIYLVDKMNAAQSEIRIGKIGMKYDATGEFYKSTVMNFALGGAFNSRININLRETNGWSYGARSFFSGSEYNGTFTASAGVRRSATDSAVREFLKEINTYREKGITDAELAFTKSSILSSDALDYETGFQKAGYLSTIQRYKLSKDFKDKQRAIVNSMTKEDINQLAKTQLGAENMVIVVVGDEFFIRKPLEKLNVGKVVTVESDKPLKLPNTFQLK